MLQRRLLGLVRQAPLQVTLTVVLALCATACAVGQALVIATILRRVFQQAPLAGLYGLAAAAVGLVAARAALLCARDLSGHWTAAVIKTRLRDRLYSHLLDLGPGFTLLRRSGDLQATVADGVEAIQAYIGFYAPQAAVAVIAPLVLVGIMISIDPVVGLVVLGGALVVPIARPLWRKILGVRGKRTWDAWAALAARMLDALQGMVTLKTLNASKRHGEDLREYSAELYRATVGNLAVNLSVHAVVNLAFSVGTAMAVATGAIRLASGQLDFASLLIILVLAAECFQPLVELQTYWHEGFYGIAASSGIFGLLDAEPLVTDPPSPREIEVRSAPAVTFSDVTFRYPGNDQPALDGVSFAVAPGSTLAVVGRSGSGKTTVSSLLLRFFDPQSGSVRVDGVGLRELPVASARALSSVVSQDVYLFHGSVADNLRLARPGASDDEIVAAAEAANAHEFIAALPAGYETMVGERGATLSGGERQRIAIARALLKDAPILVLDEATSSVDAANEAAIQEALARLTRGRTTLVIAHRLSTVARADQMIVLDRGRVAEAGAPADLLARRGHYARLVAAQRGAA